jgi:hypothetical protein
MVFKFVIVWGPLVKPDVKAHDSDFIIFPTMGCARLKFYNLVHAMNQTGGNSAAHCNEIYEQTVFFIPDQQFIAGIKIKILKSLHSIE